MKCQQCNQDLRVANNIMKSEEGSTDVYSVQTLVCVNSKCGSYAGTDLTKPLKVAQTLRNKVN